jgi:HEAT repeat protein
VARKRQACIWALAQVKPENIVEKLIPFLKHNDPETVRLVISTSKQIGSAKAPAALRNRR